MVIFVAFLRGIDFEISKPLTLAVPSNISRVNSCDGTNNAVCNSRMSP